MTIPTRIDEPLRQRAPRVAILALLALSVLVPASYSPPAHAQPAAKAAERKACGDGYERAQELRKEGKLKASRAELAVCSRPVCSDAVAQQCTQWITEIEQAQPTIALAATDAEGRDLTAVKVSVDGVVLATSLDGMAVPMDPGKHVLVFERTVDGGPQRVEVPVLVAEGEKRRKVSGKFPATTSASVAPLASTTASADTPPPPPPEPARPLVPVAAWVTGGLAVVAGGAGLVFHLSASSAKSDLDASNCKPFCAKSDVDSIEQKRLFRNIGFIVAGASVAATVVLVVRQPKRPAEARGATPALSLAVTSPAFGSSALWLQGSF